MNCNTTTSLPNSEVRVLRRSGEIGRNADAEPNSGAEMRNSTLVSLHLMQIDIVNDFRKYFAVRHRRAGTDSSASVAEKCLGDRC